MIGWAEQAYRHFTEKKHGAVPLPASLFAKTGAGIEDYPFDLFISEDHGLDYQVSDHPLQNGCVVSDHVHRQLRKCTIEGMFTNRPMSKATGNRDKVEIDPDLEKNVMSDGTVMGSPVPNTAMRRYKDLEALAEKRGTVRLVTSLVTYPKMVITSLKTTRDAKTGDCVRFTMELREVTIVDLKQAQTVYVHDSDEYSKTMARITASTAYEGLQSASQENVDQLNQLTKQATKILNAK